MCLNTAFAFALETFAISVRQNRSVKFCFTVFLLPRKCPRRELLAGVVEGPNAPKQRFGEDPVGTEGGGWNFDALPNGSRMAKQQHAYYLFIIISKSFSGAHSTEWRARALSCRALNYQSDVEGPRVVAAAAYFFLI
jgi:hypothetical protein